MGIPQTTYGTNPAVAFAGQIADAMRSDTISRIAKHDIIFGIAVMQYMSGDGQCDKLGSSADIVLGVTVYDASLPPAGSLNGSSYAGAYVAGMETRILRKGRIWVYAEQDVTPASDVYARYATSGGNTTLGKFRKDGDSSTALQITAARWLTTTTAGNLALLEVNLP